MRRLVLLLALVAKPALADTPRPVVSEIITPGQVQSRSFTSTVEAEVTTNFACLTLGRLASLDVAAGDRVLAGVTLATLDQVTLPEGLAAAEAALQGAQARAQFSQQALTACRNW